MSDESDTPDTPPEVLAKQAKSRALTPQTAELIGSKEYLNDAGQIVGGGSGISAATRTAAANARIAAETFMGGEPHRGLTVENVAVSRGKSYPDAPRMDPMLGDRTPAFVNWLWSNKPNEAKIRYAYRDIWPTALPAVWPPKKEPLKVVTPRRRGPNKPKPAALETPLTSVTA